MLRDTLRDPAFYAISALCGIVLAFFAGVKVAQLETVSKEGFRQAIAEISKRCGK